MSYAAKGFVAKIVRRIGRRAEGKRAERERINRTAAARDVQISPELAKILADAQCMIDTSRG